MPPKAGKAMPKEQRNIASYFGGKEKKTMATDESDSGEDVAVNKKASPDMSNLPPINKIPAIFEDIVHRIPEIKNIAQHLKGRKLRVATMCSGTESPLLALGLICRSMKEEYGIAFDVEHVFSCEIEPFKQAYIERNFKPPILFRDVCELGGDEATTAYGSLVEVPGDVDILIAGTSCVDYSSLNNEKQDIEADGESGRTFRGMMSWVTNHRPPIVILENVCSAPWKKVQGYFEKQGYSAEFLRVDTKDFYIPHTRTRVYLMAVDERKSKLPKEWAESLKKLSRPASVSLDAFMLPSDDPRIHIAREKLVKEGHGGVDRRAGRIDWSKCESRHHRARIEGKLGTKRPLTGWEDGGVCRMPDFAWNDWGTAQVERVWDLMDITILRSAVKGYDPSFKTLVWNLSQNVDRAIGSSRMGVSPCLTPTMIPYITNRGGPMVGLEALSLQGLPIDELLLTRETEDQLADLAGNAMSSTVVGVAILTALIVSKKLLKVSDHDEEMEVEHQMEFEPQILAIEDGIVGDSQLIEQPLDLSISCPHELSPLLKDAQNSSRFCECEGRSGITERPVLRCQDCGATVCDKCGGRPEHNYQKIDLTISPRIPPSTFSKTLKSSLPMVLSISRVTETQLDPFRQSYPSIPNKKWETWKTATIQATMHELRFAMLKRQEIWSAIYESPTAMLELVLHHKCPEWRLFGRAKASEPANSDVRRMLSYPIARLVCGKDNLLQGQWDFALPQPASFKVEIKGVGAKVTAWEAKLGLEADEFKTRNYWSDLEITVAEADKSHLDCDVSGVYTWLDKCGTANSALHKRSVVEGSPHQLPLFFFLDPTRCGETDDDQFVFSFSTRRYQFGETRPIIAKLESSWRQNKVGDSSMSVTCQTSCKWVPVEDLHLTASQSHGATFAVPTGALQVSPSNEACGTANAILVCKVPIGNDASLVWPRQKWIEVDPVHERTTFQDLAWLMERIRSIQHLNTWIDLELPEDHSICERCAPTAPALKWKKNPKGKIIAIEDASQAGAYEQALKHRPKAFVTHLHLDEETGVGTVRIAINVASLVHRALYRLPPGPDKPQLSWRLTTEYIAPVQLSLPKFVIIGNRLDPEHAQPPSFIINLRPEQLRSLDWMLRQELPTAAPFIEEEISEAVLEPLGWRVEGKAQRAHHIRGGVLADAVGYGKTAITLGLIDCAPGSPVPASPETKGTVPVKATLVIVPPHLTRQWASEVRKFTGDRFDVLVIATASNLNSVTIQRIKKADIVVVASNLFHSNIYLSNLDSFAAAGPLPAQEGRYFSARLEHALQALGKQVELLKSEGAAAVMKNVKDSSLLDDEAHLFVPSKRLKGKQYREAAGKQEKSKEASSSKGGSSIHSETGSMSSLPNRFTPSSHGDSSPPSPTSRPVSFSSISSHKRKFVMEVEITRANLPKRPRLTDLEDSDEEDKDARRTRRARNAPIVISDDDEVMDAPNPVKVRLESFKKKKASGKKAAKKPATSGEDDFLASDEEDEDMAADSSEADPTQSEDLDDEEDKPKGRKKAPSKPKPKPKPKKAAEKSQGKSKKRKSDVLGDDEEQPKKKPKVAKPKASRADSDPWKLNSKEVREHWYKMQAPPLEMFHWHRVVVDEYTYLAGKSHTLITALKATCRWVLSGTPPIHDFASLKTIAVFLGLHLGIDDDGEGNSAQVKKRRREQTSVEKFHSFREVHSLDWHANRHELGQRFLNQFVRQNVAEIDEIPLETHMEPIVLPAAERAIYLELEHHLRALDMVIKRGKKTDSDREKRLAQSLGESNSAEEALLKRCSHFDLDPTDKENAMKACEVIVQDREMQLEECKAEILNSLLEAFKTAAELAKRDEDSPFRKFIHDTRETGLGDQEATSIVLQLIDEARPKDSKSSGKSGRGKEDDDLWWEHREQTHAIRRLTKECVGRVRSLRYFRVVRDLQSETRKESPTTTIDCPLCGKTNLPISDIGVLSSCGHTGCYSCILARAKEEECVYKASTGCQAAARVLNVVKAETLGVDDFERDGKGRHFGAKLERVVELIKTGIPGDERVLVFVQFPDLMKKVATAFDAHEIQFLEIKGTAIQKSKNLEKFQAEDSTERVLLLNVMDESASGANLTLANHAIFLSPLLTPTQQIYEANETQAIGRLQRYGQTKLVHIYRFLTKDSIDVEIYQDRTGIMY